MKLTVLIFASLLSFSSFAEDLKLSCGIGRVSRENQNFKYYSQAPIHQGKGMLVITRGVYTYVLKVNNGKYHAFKTNSLSGGYEEEKNINITANIYSNEAQLIDDVWCYIFGWKRP